LFNVYVETVALTYHSYTGERFSGIAPAAPVKGYDDRPVKHTDFPLELITYKEIVGGQSRTAPDYWLDATLTENKILINAATARKLGFKDGDRARLTSATNSEGVWDLKNGQQIPVEGKVKVLQGMRPGVVAVSWHYGHWAYGSNDVIIDGQSIPGEKSRGRGLCPNAVMATDPVLKNVTLEDLIGGSASYYDTSVKLTAV